ncbi:non-specific serine/threonine protein kinase [Ranunculus cassubicifolius]
MDENRFPLEAKHYKLCEEVGEGVSATVYRALCIPLNEVVAIKVLDLERCNNDFDGIRREVQTMILTNHPNLLRAHCSFTADQSLWVVMPYMAGGSCLHIMKTSYPEGFEEAVIATLLREVLKALVYLHGQGHIHRDVKAGNILVDSNGSVKLGDFGVSACMFDTGDRQRSRNTFVGTPCWMAPEVMQQLHGYDFKADIWSFGITALELAHGHAPFSKYPPMKVLLMTLQNAPPGLDYERDKRFTKSFKEMVSACLMKDPKKRPSSEKLLKHPFFKHARPYEYLAKTILDGLPPLGDRFRLLKAKEASFLVQSKGDKDQLSQQKYIRGISAWDFNVEYLKQQAALLEDFDGVSSTDDLDYSSGQRDGFEDFGFVQETITPIKTSHSISALKQEDELNDINNVEDSLSSFPTLPLQALKECFDVGDDDENAHCLEQESPPRQEELEAKKDNSDLERSSSFPKHVISAQNKKFSSGSILPENVLSPSRNVNGIGERESNQSKYQVERNYSGPLHRPKRESNNYASEETSEGTVVQLKGRFKVTSADRSPKGVTNTTVTPFSGPTISSTPTVTAASVLPPLQYILQQNNMQREQIVKLIKYLEQNPGHHSDITADTVELPQGSSTREKELQGQVNQLQQSIGSMVEELQRVKMRNAQLERQLNVILSNKEEDRIQREQS